MTRFVQPLHRPPVEVLPGHAGGFEIQPHERQHCFAYPVNQIRQEMEQTLRPAPKTFSVVAARFSSAC